VIRRDNGILTNRERRGVSAETAIDREAVRRSTPDIDSRRRSIRAPDRVEVLAAPLKRGRSQPARLRVLAGSYVTRRETVRVIRRCCARYLSFP